MESGFARLAQLGQQKQVWGRGSSSHPAMRIKDTKPRERLRCVSGSTERGGCGGHVVREESGFKGVKAKHGDCRGSCRQRRAQGQAALEAGQEGEGIGWRAHRREQQSQGRCGAGALKARDTYSKRRVKTRSRERKFSVPGTGLSNSGAGEGGWERNGSVAGEEEKLSTG